MLGYFPSSQRDHTLAVTRSYPRRSTIKPRVPFVTSLAVTAVIKAGFIRLVSERMANVEV